MYDPYKHHRRSIRLKGYDYSQPGTYFITICTHNRACLFGEVVDGDMVLNANGRIARQLLIELARLYPQIRLEEFVIMPNHVHAILVITVQIDGLDKRSLGQMVGAYKFKTTKWINSFHKRDDLRVWQRNFYEHIIRNERELGAIRQYIIANPQNWPQDRDNLP